LYFSNTGTICSDENPWIVVTTGVSTRPLNVNGRKSKLFWITSNSLARSNAAEMCNASQAFACNPGSSE